jgi:hypothetical protein
VNIARAQGAAFEVAELVENEQRMVACLLEVWNRLHLAGRRGPHCPAWDIGRLIRDAMGLAVAKPVSRNAAAQ